MAFAFVQSGISADGNATAVTLTGVGAGNLIFLTVKWEGSASLADCSVSDGTTAFTMGTATKSGALDQYFQCAWLLVANGGNKTYTVTFPASATWREIIVEEFSYSGTITKDASAEATGDSDNYASGNITLATVGESELVLGAGAAYLGLTTYTNEVINSVDASATTVQGWNVYSAIFYRIVTAAFTGQAACTSSNTFWNCHIVAFKEAGSGGLAPGQYQVILN